MVAYQYFLAVQLWVIKSKLTFSKIYYVVFPWEFQFIVHYAKNQVYRSALTCYVRNLQLFEFLLS